MRHLLRSRRRAAPTEPPAAPAPVTGVSPVPGTPPAWGALGAAVLALLLGLAGVLEPLELALFDLQVAARFRLGPTSRAASDIAVVAIDEPSLARLGRWPWPPELHAQLLARLAGARPAAVLIDLILAEPSHTPGDAALARAARGVPLYLPGGPDAPFPLLAAAATGLGSARLPVDPDGRVRRLASPPDTPGLPPLAWLAASRLAADRPAVRGPAAPARAPATWWLDFRRPPVLRSPFTPTDLFATFSYADVLTGKVPAQALEGRVVLIGATAPGLAGADRALTGLRPLGPIPGVFIHANAVRALLDPHPVRRHQALALALAAVMLPAAWWAFHRPPRARRRRAGDPVAPGGAASMAAIAPIAAVAAIAPALLLLGYATVALLLFVGRGVWLDLATPAAALLTLQGALLGEGHLRERRRRLRIQTIFSRYVNTAVLAQLLRDPDHALPDQGRRQAVTVMVADLCGFTALAQPLRPEQVVQLLNTYLDLMARPVLEAGGMLDKYLGDGILALFGAPRPDPAHAATALATARAIQQRIAELNRARVAAALPALEVRIALHSGDVVLANLGIAERSDYTAVGDAVNLCSRLEKEAGPGEVLASRATLELAVAHLGGQLAALPLDDWDGPQTVQIRGRTGAVEVFRWRLPLPAPGATAPKAGPPGGLSRR